MSLTGSTVTSAGGQTWLIGDASFGGNISGQVSWQTEAGTDVRVKLGRNNTTKEIGATLYLKYVKSKLGKIQIEKSKNRLAKLQKLVSYSKEMGQQALYEELTREVAMLVQETEMWSFGVDRWLLQHDIDKFRHMIKDKVIKWDQLQNFPRIVPASVQQKVKKLKKANIFDEYWILFIDYTGAAPLKTNKEKIKQKDPILFGRQKFQPDRFYFIADWVDEYCDLTLDKLVTKIKVEDPEFALNQTKEITEDRWNGIVKEVRERSQRLTDARPNNFRDLMAQEDEKKISLWGRFISWCKKIRRQV